MNMMSIMMSIASVTSSQPLKYLSETIKDNQKVGPVRSFPGKQAFVSQRKTSLLPYDPYSGVSTVLGQNKNSFFAIPRSDNMMKDFVTPVSVLLLGT